MADAEPEAEGASLRQPVPRKRYARLVDFPGIYRDASTLQTTLTIEADAEGARAYGLLTTRARQGEGAARRRKRRREGSPSRQQSLVRADTPPSENASIAEPLCSEADSSHNTEDEEPVPEPSADRDGEAADSGVAAAALLANSLPSALPLDAPRTFMEPFAADLAATVETGLATLFNSPWMRKWTEAKDVFRAGYGLRCIGMTGAAVKHRARLGGTEQAVAHASAGLFAVLQRLAAILAVQGEDIPESVLQSCEHRVVALVAAGEEAAAARRNETCEERGDASAAL